MVMLLRVLKQHHLWNYCLATTGSSAQAFNPVDISVPQTYQYWQPHTDLSSSYPSNTLRGLYGVSTIFLNQYGQLTVSKLPPIPASYEAYTTDYTNLQLTNYPTNIYLPYGYYIPIYIAYNDNISGPLGQVGNCNYLNKTTYYSIPAYFENMSENQWVCWENGPAKTSPSGIIYGALVTQPTETLTISIYTNQEEVTYQANESNGVYQIGDSASYLTGFTSTLNLIVEGADTTYQYVNQNEYQILVSGIPSLSEENAYGFYSKIEP